MDETTQRPLACLRQLAQLYADLVVRRSLTTIQAIVRRGVGSPNYRNYRIGPDSIKLGQTQSPIAAATALGG